jgi:hypothetical protein
MTRGHFFRLAFNDVASQQYNMETAVVLKRWGGVIFATILDAPELRTAQLPRSRLVILMRTVLFLIVLAGMKGRTALDVWRTVVSGFAALCLQIFLQRAPR